MKGIITTILIMTGIMSYGQDMLTIEDAMAMALKNNFDILVSGNDADIARVNNTYGNAGMLPEVKLSGSGNYEVNTIQQKLKGGDENKYSALPTNSLSAGTELSWTLFDGGKMFVTKRKLNEIQTLGELQFREQVLKSLYEVISGYYDVVRQKQELASINEALNYNRERVKIAQAGFNAGSLLKTDLLQAKIDLNVNRENAINQEVVIASAKKDLNRLLGRDPDTPFGITDTITSSYFPNKDEILKQVDSNNAALLAYRKQLDIARLSVKESQKLFAPVLNFRAGYYLSQSNSPYGTVLNNLSYGPGIGGSLSIPLYSAGENKRIISAAKIRQNSAEYELQNISLVVNTALLNVLTDFENQQRLLVIEKENNELTRENLAISLQRLRLGQTTSLEVHQAQDDFVRSNTRLINFQYNLKMAETRLKQLMASLADGRP